MKITTRRHTTPTLLLATVAISSQVVAQTKSDQPTQTPTATSKPAERPYGEDSDVGPLVFRRLQQYRQFRTDLFADVPMSQEEKDAVSKTFEQFFQEMRENVMLATRYYGRPTIDPQQREALKKQRDDAIARGDTEEATRLATRIYEGSAMNEGNIVSTIDVFLERLEPNFKPDQREAYEAVVTRWKTIESDLPLDGAIRMLERSLKDSKLKLSDQQRQNIDKILKKTKNKRPRGRRFVEVWKKLADKALSQIAKQLDSRQNAQLTSTYTAFQKRWDALVEFKEYRKIHPYKHQRSQAPPEESSSGTPED